MNSGVELQGWKKNQEVYPMRAPKIVRTRSGRTITYAFHFSSSQFGGTTAFRFTITAATAAFDDPSDWAPDHQYIPWYYDLLSR